jgi:hypothetical protein
MHVIENISEFVMAERPSGIPTLHDVLETQFAPIAAALTEELTALLAALLDHRRKQMSDAWVRFRCSVSD